MPFTKSARIAAIVSQAIVVLWAGLTVLSNLFQDKLLTLYMDSYVIENTDKITSRAVIVRCIAALIVSGANILICSRKTVYTPVVMASVTAGLLPFVVRGMTVWQTMMKAKFEGANVLARLNVVQQIESSIAYFFSAAMVITIAAGAVYAYARKNCPETEEFSQEGEAYAIADN